MRRPKQPAIRSSAPIEISSANATHVAGLRQMYDTFEPKQAAFGVPPVHETDVWLTRVCAQCQSWVATAEARIVGHCAICVQDNEAEFMLFIHQDARRMGIGRRLLGILIDEARHRRLHCLWAVVEIDNVPMLKLAVSMGFQHGQGDGEVFLTLAGSPATCARAATSPDSEDDLKAA